MPGMPIEAKSVHVNIACICSLTQHQDNMYMCFTSCNDHFIINHLIKGNQEVHFRQFFM